MFLDYLLLLPLYQLRAFSNFLQLKIQEMRDEHFTAAQGSFMDFIQRHRQVEDDDHTEVSLHCHDTLMQYPKSTNTGPFSLRSPIPRQAHSGGLSFAVSTARMFVIQKALLSSTAPSLDGRNFFDALRSWMISPPRSESSAENQAKTKRKRQRIPRAMPLEYCS